jgi:hypothetical protein
MLSALSSPLSAFSLEFSDQLCGAIGGSSLLLTDFTVFRECNSALRLCACATPSEALRTVGT